MDRMKSLAFLGTIVALVALEWASPYLHRVSWGVPFSPLAWTALVRSMDILLFLIMFRVLSVPVSTAGLKRPATGTLIGLAVSLVLGGGFFLFTLLIRLLWKVDLTALLGPGGRVRGVGSLVVLCLVGPFTEELFFRGLFYTLIKTHTAVWFAVISSTVLFSASHLLGAGTLHAMLVPLCGGVVLALLYELTGSLFAPFALHAVANLVLFTRII